MNVLTVLMLLLAGAAATQAYDDASITSGSYWKAYATDTRQFITAPARWDGTAWAAAGLIVSSGIGLYYADENLRNAFQRNRSDAAETYFEITNWGGDGRATLPLLAVLYTGGKLTNSSKTTTAALTGLESFILANTATQSLKYLLHRHRPFSEDGRGAWDGPSFSKRYESFPSGHTTAAFSVASAVAGTWNTPAAYGIAYGLALSTGLARMYFDKHWASDVFAGAVIGSVTGHTLARHHRNSGNTGFSLKAGMTGSRLVYHW